MAQSQHSNDSKVRNSVRSLSTSKQFLFSIIIMTGAFGCLELAVRVGAYFAYGQSPYFLFYGMESAMADDDPEGHSFAQKGYFKFQPNRVLHQYGLFEKPTPIRINSLGFRGNEFSHQKPPNTFRVICMGESSTFGFFDRDDYTYPAILERVLTQTFGPGKVEVINVGIPHADSDNLVAMLKGELLSYQPDLITIYAGYNDAGQVMDATSLQKTLRWVHGHVATYVALKRLISALGGPELYSRWSVYGGGGGSREAHVKRQIELHLERFDRNIREIISLAEPNRIRVVLVKQAFDAVGNRRKNRDIFMTYRKEVEQVSQRLQMGEAISANEVTLLVHSALMERLQSIAVEKHLPTVDNIVIADEHPEYFASYVHLTEDGNEALAKALSSTTGEFVPRHTAQ